MKQFHVLAVAVLASALLVSGAMAQTTTGRIRGEVVAGDGAALAGATVTVTGAALMGERTAVTGDTGDFWFTGLAPGSYELTAELQGFQPKTVSEVKVRLAGVANVTIALVPEFSEAVIVAGEIPLVNLNSSAVDSLYSAEFIEDLPTNRNFYDLMSVSGGVSLATEDSDRLVAFGSNVQSNAWYIDGIETTAPETGTAWVYVNPDMVEEIQVSGIGAPAEYGNMLGAALNVVTKSGSNTLEGGVNLYWFDNSLVDSAINFRESQFSEYEQKEFWDVTATLGGPIKKDRLWYFAAYEYWRDGHSFPGADPTTTPTWYSDRYDVKLSLSLNPSNQLEAKGYLDEWGYPAPSSEFVAPSALAGEVGDTTAWGLAYQSIINDRTVLEARYSGWSSNDDNLSQTGSTEPAFIDYSPPGGGPTTFSGGVWYPWTYDTSTDQLSASVSRFADDFLKGDHDFKFGVQVSEGDAETLVAPSATGTYYYHYAYDYYGYVYEYFYRVDGRSYFYGNEQSSWALFVDDSWQVNDRLTLNLGLRYDHQEGALPAFPRFAVGGAPTGEIIPGVDPAFEWDNFSPRLGFAYVTGAEQKGVVRGSFGVYYDGNVGGNWNYPPPGHPGLDYFTSLSGSFDGPYEYAFSWNPGTNIIDPDLEAPRTLQYSLGFERQVGDNYSVGVQAVYKDTTNLIGWEILNDGVYTPIPFTDPFTGRQYTLLDAETFPTVRKGNSPGATVDPAANEYWQEYSGIMLTLNRRYAGRWSMQASYTYSESTGLIPRFLSQWQFNPFYSSREGADPNSFLNANGQKLQGDRPHMLRVQTNVELPKGFHANAAINLQSGRPFTRQARLPTQGRPVAIMETGFRHPFQTLVDLGIGKSFAVGPGEIKVDAQFLNLLNDDATDWWETVVLDAGESFRGNTWVKPRRVQLRLGYRF